MLIHTLKSSSPCSLFHGTTLCGNQWMGGCKENMNFVAEVLHLTKDNVLNDVVHFPEHRTCWKWCPSTRRYSTHWLKVVLFYRLKLFAEIFKISIQKFSIYSCVLYSCVVHMVPCATNRKSEGLIHDVVTEFFFSLLNPSSYTMALAFTHPLTGINTG